MARNSLFFFSILIFPFISSAQYEMTPYNSSANLQNLKQYGNDSILENQIYRSSFIITEESGPEIKKYNSRFMRFLRNRHFLELNDSTITLYADPYFNFSDTRHGDTSFSSNSRGLIFRGKLADNFYFMSAAVENQVYYPDYLREYYKNKRVISGLGRYKGFKTTGFDYSFAFGQIYWKPVNFLIVEAGHGKQFIGEGYRSLILSDFSSFYPFLKITGTFRKWQFVHMLTAFQDIKSEDSRELVYQRSHGTFTSVGYHFSEKLKLSLTESIVWQTYGEGFNNRFPATFFIPVPFFKPFVYGLSDPNNISLGLNVSWRPIYSIMLYGQFLADDFQALHKEDSLDIYNRYGYQAGFRIIEPFKVKNLFLLAEYNRVMPYTYSSSLRRQAYAGMNEPLAHPLGANFGEIVVQGNYRFKSIYISASYSSALTGRDPAGTNYGAEISISDTTATLDQPLSEMNPPGVRTNISNLCLEAGYIINPKYNFAISAGIRQRRYKVESGTSETNIVFIKLSTNLLTTYTDF